MVGIWSAARECSDKGIRLFEHSLVQEIASYNEIDCRAMAEVLGWLRRNR
jgi:predicted RecB family nuclease